MDLYLNLSFHEVFGAMVHVEYGRLIVLRKLIVKVVTNEARFADRSIANEDHFDFHSAFDGPRLIDWLWFYDFWWTQRAWFTFSVILFGTGLGGISMQGSKTLEDIFCVFPLLFVGVVF